MCLPISHEVVIGKWTKKHINIIFRYLFKDYFKVHTNFRIKPIGGGPSDPLGRDVVLDRPYVLNDVIFVSNNMWKLSKKYVRMYNM